MPVCCCRLLVACWQSKTACATVAYAYLRRMGSKGRSAAAPASASTTGAEAEAVAADGKVQEGLRRPAAKATWWIQGGNDAPVVPSVFLRTPEEGNQEWSEDRPSEWVVEEAATNSQMFADGHCGDLGYGVRIALVQTDILRFRSRSWRL